MTLTECTNKWVKLYLEFYKDVETARKSNPDYDVVVKELSKKYKVSQTNTAFDMTDFEICEAPHRFIVSIGTNDDGEAGLSAFVGCCFIKDMEPMDCLFAELKDPMFIERIRKLYGEHFDNHVYTISVADMTEKVCYEDEATVIDYEVEEDAVNAARELAKGLSDNYPQCFCISVFAGERRTPEGDVVGENFDIFTVSSKTKGETMRARRLAGYTSLEVNEYIDTIPSKKTENMANVVMLNVVSLDGDGNTSIYLERYHTREEAEKDAERMLNEWLSEHNATLDEHTADTEGLILCTKEDYSNLVEVHSTEDIAEFNSLIKEYSA